MSVLEIKNDLLRLMSSTNDSEALLKTRIVLKIFVGEELTQEEFNIYTAKLADRGLKQVNAGQTRPHTEVRKQIDKLLQKK